MSFKRTKLVSSSAWIESKEGLDLLKKSAYTIRAKQKAIYLDRKFPSRKK